MIPKTSFAFLLLTLTCTAPLFAKDPQSIEGARKEYESAKGKNEEAAREQYVATLGKIMRGHILEYRKTGTRHDDEMNVLNREMRKHPAPKSLDAAKLTPLRVGKWLTPRHDFLYKKDGTYVMLPEEKDATRGKWRLAGNEFIQTNAREETHYTIIVLNAECFVYEDQEMVFLEARAK